MTWITPWKSREDYSRSKTKRENEVRKENLFSHKLSQAEIEEQWTLSCDKSSPDAQEADLTGNVAVVHNLNQDFQTHTARIRLCSVHQASFRFVYDDMWCLNS